MFLGIQHLVALHPHMVVRGCGFLWVILGKNGVSFSRKLGRGFSACITLRFCQQNIFWIITWFVKHREHHEWYTIKPGVCSANVFTTAHLRMAKYPARETLRLVETLLEWKAHSASLQWVLIQLKLKTLGNVHTFSFVWAGGTSGGADLLGAHLTS